MARKTNFYAGPSVLPVEVFEKISKEIVDYKGSGLSLVETSHRSPIYDEVHQGAINLIRELYKVPENFKILFIGGGATMQFAMIPMNFLKAGQKAAYTATGTWAKKAIQDAKKVGEIDVVFDGADSKYTTLPENLELKEKYAYLHITSNETIGGIQWKNFPEVGDTPIIADMSSDIMSRHIPWEKFGMVYAGAQKNLGPSGLAIAIIREDLIEDGAENLPAYLSYKTHAESNSLYNTPPVFPIWAMKLVLERMKELGGIEYFVKHNEEKAAIVYDMMEKYSDFYKTPVPSEIRSLMNIVFTTPNEDLDKKLIAEATELGMVGLKGHRSVGGCRASTYNSMTIEGVKKLADLMEKFAKANS